MNGRLRVGVQIGEGTVARFPGVAAVIAPGPDAFTDPLLDLLGEPSPAPELLWGVAALVSAARPGVPDFALLVDDAGVLRVLRYGAARLLVDGNESGAPDPITWREEAVPAGTATVALTVVPGPVAVHPRSNLRDGVARGTGLVLELGTQVSPAPRVPSPATAPVPAAPPPPTPVADAGFAPVTPRQGSQGVPTPQPADDPGAAVPVPPPPLVDDDPGDTVYLAADLLALEARDGRRVPLDRNYVFGRSPRLDPSVASGASSPVQISAEDHLVSRVHAFVDIRGGVVVLRDGGSANGTHFARPGDTGWTRVGADPVPISLGWSVRIGRQVFTVVKNPAA